jgi:hypothetical protein
VGALLAAAALVRLDSIALWPAGAVGVARAAPGRRVRTLGAFGAPLLLAAALLGAHNAGRFGSPLMTGYEHMPPGSATLAEGLAALLASPGKGLLIYGPVAFAGLIGLGGLRRLDASVALYVAAGAALLASLTASTVGWRIGWDWGPRYLHTSWTLAGLGLAFVGPAGHRATIALAAWGLGVNLVGASSDFTRHLAAAGGTDAVLWNLDAWPVAAQARAMSDGRIDLPVVRTWLLAAGLAAAGALGLRAALAAARGPE